MPTLTAARKKATLTLIANYLDNMSDALDHITAELAHTSANVYPTQTALAANSYTDTNGRIITVGSGGGSRGPSASPVERAVIDSHTKLRDAQAQLWDDFNAICSIAHTGSRLATATNKRHVPGHQHKRCNHGTGESLKGFTLWQDEDCERFPGVDPVIAGMCDHCTDRMNDWRIANGLERLTRDADTRNYRESMDLRNVRQGPNGRFERAS